MSFSPLSLRAWAFLWSIFALSLSLVVLTVPLSPVAAADWVVFAILLALACATQFMEARFGRQTYTPHLVPFFAGSFLLPAPLFILLVLFPHLLEWLHKRLTNSNYLPVWYIQPFNISTHILAGLSTQFLIQVLTPLSLISGIPADFSAGVAGIILYVCINHYLVGQVLVLARGISWSDSRMWSVEVLTPDIAMLAVGYVVAILWNFSPWLVIPALAPLGLMFQAMKVPQLQQEARTDEKTGLLNSRHFKERFEEELLLAKRFNRPLAILMADLDLLRNINNTYGHLAGDIVIAGIADVLRQETRDYDIAARFGGEEYAVVLPNTTTQVAYTLAERLRRRTAERQFQVPNGGVGISASISIGVASMPENGETMDALIHEADVALYQAKYRGRNQVVCAVDVPHSFRLEYGGEAGRKAREQREEPASETDKKKTKEAEGAEERQEFENFRNKVEPSSRPVLALSAAAITPAPRPEAPPDQKTKESATKLDQQNSHSLFIPYLVLVICGGVAATVWGVLNSAGISPTTLLTFAILAVLAESLNVKMYVKSTVSASATVTLAALLVTGLPGAIATGSSIAIIHFLRQRPPLYRASFNWSVHILAGIIPAFIFQLVSFPMTLDYTIHWGITCIIAAFPYFLVETGLIARAIALNYRSSVVAVWQEQFAWLTLHYAIMGVLSVFVALAYELLGVWGLVGFALPVFLIHQSQKMYVERTETSVAELHRMNNELQVANREVERASGAIHSLNMELLEMLAKIIDARDPETSGHALQVSEYAVAIGRQCNLSPERLENLRWAGMLHDIGKLGVPEKILLKPGALTPEEYTQVKKHAALGGNLLETVRGLSHLAPFVRHHHERWDGTGYPAGLAGEEIPVEARILAVCDATEAMSAARPYKQGYTTEDIRNELQRCSGGQFDPFVAEILIRELTVTSPRSHQARGEAVTNVAPTNGVVRHKDGEYPLPVSPVPGSSIPVSNAWQPS